MKRCLAVVLAIAACDLNLANPNAPPQTVVLNTVDGIVALAVGMQSQYASGVGDFVIPPSLVTDEWGTTTKSLLAYQSLLSGENFSNSFVVVLAPWADAYRTIKSANDLLVHAPLVIPGSGLQAGIVSLAQLYKALALGTLVLQYEQVPMGAGTGVPQPRGAVLDSILDLLESARTDFTSLTATDLAEFNARVLGTGFNVLNTIDAMRARYYLIAGQYAQAIDAADSVKANVLSVFTYTPPARNPVYDLSTSGPTGYVAALKSFKDLAAAGDRRVGYWADTLATSFKGNPDSSLVPLKKFSTPNEPYPVYLPDEMKLIKAEAFTQVGVLDSAAFYVNAVRTQTSSVVDEPVAALPALDPATQLDTPQKLLAQIAYERRYELFAQGLRWEDTRRLGTAVTTTPTFSWLPVPLQECRANPSAGC